MPALYLESELGDDVGVLIQKMVKLAHILGVNVKSKHGIILKSKALKIISSEQEKYKDLIFDGKKKFSELIEATKDDIKKRGPNT